MLSLVTLRAQEGVAKRSSRSVHRPFEGLYAFELEVHEARLNQGRKTRRVDELAEVFDIRRNLFGAWRGERFFRAVFRFCEIAVAIPQASFVGAFVV